MLQPGARLAVDVLVDVEVLLEYLIDLLPDLVILGVDLFDVARDEQEFDHLIDDVIDSFVAHLEAAHVGHLALDLIEFGMVVTAPLERVARGLVHALFGGEVLLEDGRHVHLGVRDAHRLHLDVPIRHERGDRIPGDGGNDLRVELHAAQSFHDARPRGEAAF